MFTVSCLNEVYIYTVLKTLAASTATLYLSPLFTVIQTSQSFPKLPFVEITCVAKKSIFIDQMYTANL